MAMKIHVMVFSDTTSCHQKFRSKILPFFKCRNDPSLEMTSWKMTKKLVKEDISGCSAKSGVREKGDQTG
jgi:hypothetical protein